MAVSAIAIDRPHGIVTFRATAAGDVSPAFLLEPGALEGAAVGLAKVASGTCSVALQWQPNSDWGASWVTPDEGYDAVEAAGHTLRAMGVLKVRPGWHRLRIASMAGSGQAVTAWLRVAPWVIDS